MGKYWPFGNLPAGALVRRQTVRERTLCPT